MAFPPQIQRRIIADNLHTQERQISTALEARRSHLSDLARVLVDTLPTGHITSRDLAALTAAEPLLDPREVVLHREALEENKKYLPHVLGALARADRVALCRYIFLRLQSQGRAPTMADFLPAPALGSRIAYTRNNYSDEAFSAFAYDLPTPTALYTDDYDAACAAVRAGEASYCILPYRDAKGERVRTGLALLQSYDLMVCAICSVRDGEDNTLLYALCGTSPMLRSSKKTLLLHLQDFPHSRTGEFLDAAALLGLKTEEMQFGRDMTVMLYSEGDPVPFFIWLTLFAPTYRLDGLFYDITKEQE